MNSGPKLLGRAPEGSLFTSTDGGEEMLLGACEGRLELLGEGSFPGSALLLAGVLSLWLGSERERGVASPMGGMGNTFGWGALQLVATPD